MKPFGLVFLAVSISVSAAESISTSDLSGCYSMHSPLCTQATPKGIKACGKDFKDYLFVKSIGPSSIFFRVQSQQSFGDQCEAEGEAQLDGTSFVFNDSEGGDYEGQGLKISVTKKSLIFKLLKEGTERSPYCGMHGTMNNVRFSRLTKINDQHCSLHSY